MELGIDNKILKKKRLEGNGAKSNMRKNHL
jgi:hypothetical protein